MHHNSGLLLDILIEGSTGGLACLVACLPGILEAVGFDLQHHINGTCNPGCRGKRIKSSKPSLVTF